MAQSLLVQQNLTNQSWWKWLNNRSSCSHKLKEDDNEAACLAGEITRESITAGATALRGSPRVAQVFLMAPDLGLQWLMRPLLFSCTWGLYDLCLRRRKHSLFRGLKGETSHFRKGGFIKPRWCFLGWGTEFSESLPTSRHLPQSAIVAEVFLPHGGSLILNPLNLIPGPSVSSATHPFPGSCNMPHRHCNDSPGLEEEPTALILHMKINY